MSDLQPDLFARARRSDPETSHAAAERVNFAAAHYRAISGALAGCEATIYQIASLTGLSHVQVARRLPEMQEAGIAEPTGTTAAGPTGRQCRLWRAKAPQ